MATWYKGYYGNWENGNSVHYIDGTFNRKDIMNRAREIVNEKNEVVTVSAEKGMKMQFFKVYPSK